MLALAALVLFAMMFTSCKAKIGGAKAKVEAEVCNIGGTANEQHSS